MDDLVERLPFVATVMEDSRESMKKVHEDDDLLPSEDYVLRVSHSMSLLIGILEELYHAPLYLSSFTPSERMKRGGISRAKQVRYTVENYIIRTQSLYDRILILVSEIVRIGLSHSDIQERAILRNRRVPSEVVSRLKSIRKIIDRYREPRNTIIHRGSFGDELLYIAEALEILQNEFSDEFTKEKRQDAIREWTAKFDKLNVEVINEIEKLFSILEEYYAGVRRRTEFLDDRLVKVKKGE